MINDRLTCGSIAGIAAAIIKTLINYCYFLFGITNNTYPGLILEVLLKAPQKAHFPGPFLLGTFIDSLIGAIIGIIIIYSLKIVKRRYLWYKAIIFGSFVWLISVVILLPLLYTGLKFNFYYLSLLDHWIFGFAVVTLVERLYPSKTTPLDHTEV